MMRSGNRPTRNVARLTLIGRRLNLAGLAALATLIAVTLTAPAYARPDADPRAILDAAIEAHGAERGLSAPDSLMQKGSGTTVWSQREAPYTWTAYFLGGERVRFEQRRKMGGSVRESTYVLDGDLCWYSWGTRIYECPAGNMKTELSRRPPVLLEATGSGVELSALPDKSIDDTPAVGIEAELTDGKVRFYFDAATSLLTEIEYKSMDSDGQGGKEEKVHKFQYFEWKAEDGTLVPHRIVEFEDGVRRQEVIVEQHRSDAEVLETLFIRPDEDDPRLYPEEFVY